MCRRLRLAWNVVVVVWPLLCLVSHWWRPVRQDYDNLALVVSADDFTQSPQLLNCSTYTSSPPDTELINKTDAVGSSL